MFYRIYMLYVYCGYRMTGFIVEINRLAPKPFHSCTGLLLDIYTVYFGVESIIFNVNMANVHCSFNITKHCMHTVIIFDTI